MAHWWAVHDAPFIARLTLDSAEYDRWAREIASGDWLGSEPFFQPPLYPYLLALLFRLAGHSLNLVYLTQIGLALVGLALVARVADQTLGRPHGVVAAALGAIYLPAVFHEVQLVKEGPALVLVALLLDRLVAARAARNVGTEASGDPPAGSASSAEPEPASEDEEAEGREPRAGAPRDRWSWLVAGVALGLLGLLRENALLLIPFLLPLAYERRRAAAFLRRAALFLAGVALPLLPVAARNAAVGGGPLPTTFQGGVNLWIGNNPQADGTYRPIVPGKQIPALERAEAWRLAERAVGRELSAAQVSRYWIGRVVDWARREPAAFARLELRKLALYLSPYEWPDVVDYAWMKSVSRPLRLPGLEWGGLVALAVWGAALGWRRRGAWSPVGLFELGWMLSTVAFFLFSRYRLPAAPGLYVLASLPLVSTGRAWSEAGRRGRGAPLARSFLLLAVLLIPWLAAPRPRVDLVEFNLGRLAEEQGAGEEARRHYEAALEANPRFFLAAMNLGSLAARGGHLAEGIALLERAVELQPDSDDAWANLGAARLAARDLDGAQRALERALELNRNHAAARANLQRLERRRNEGPPP